MKTKQSNIAVSAKKLSDDERLAIIASKIKGRDLFPERTKSAKKLLQNLKILAKGL